MTKKLIQFPLEDGSQMWVEVEEPDTKGLRNSSIAGETGTKTSQTFETALDAILPSLERVRGVLKDLNNPEQIEIEFGIKLSGEVGAFLASASTEANFAVKLTWKNSQDK